jgi:hypothetical protein
LLQEAATLSSSERRTGFLLARKAGRLKPAAAAAAAEFLQQLSSNPNPYPNTNPNTKKI